MFVSNSSSRKIDVIRLGNPHLIPSTLNVFAGQVDGGEHQSRVWRLFAYHQGSAHRAHVRETPRLPSHLQSQRACGRRLLDACTHKHAFADLVNLVVLPATVGVAPKAGRFRRVRQAQVAGSPGRRALAQGEEDYRARR
eukprot:3049992-Pleurochrysis_carterae.AAC.1